MVCVCVCSGSYSDTIVVCTFKEGELGMCVALWLCACVCWGDVRGCCVWPAVEPLPQGHVDHVFECARARIVCACVRAHACDVSKRGGEGALPPCL